MANPVDPSKWKGGIYKDYVNLAYLRQSRLPKSFAPNPLTLMKGAFPGLVVGSIWLWFKHYGTDPTPISGWWRENVWPAHHLDDAHEVELRVTPTLAHQTLAAKLLEESEERRKMFQELYYADLELKRSQEAQTVTE